MSDILIVGAGLFGATAAIELRRRGRTVRLLDAGDVPRAEASTVDTSKAVRLDYGTDLEMTEMAEIAREHWLGWNERFGETVYHEDGFLFLRGTEMRPDEFEHDSLRVLEQRGLELERLDAGSIAAREHWVDGRYVSGYFNPFDGWAPSGRVLELLLDEARAAGVEVVTRAPYARLLFEGDRVAGVVDATGVAHASDLVVVAAGAWTPTLLPWLSDRMWAAGQPVVYFQVDDAAAWAPPRFTTWASDISTTGWYGFPSTADGLVKVANHGAGRRGLPGELSVTEADVERARAFLREALPGLAAAPVGRTRVCFYCDTFDGDFWIDHDPDRPGLVVAAGGSGHGFKFAPLLGALIADIVERRENRFASRFGWRTRTRSDKKFADAARKS